MVFASLDILLNLLWAAIGVAALAGLAVAERRQHRNRPMCWRRLCAVLLAVICLFPSVSYSDDLVTLSGLDSRTGGRGGVGAPPGEPDQPAPSGLAGQLQSLEHCQVERPDPVLVAFCHVGVVVRSIPATVAGEVDTRPGRAPPSI